MKNKFFFIIFLLITYDFAFAESFNFQTKKIEMVNEDKLIKAEFGKATSKDGNLIINADKFVYQINNKILNASGNGSIIVKNKDLEIIFNNLIFNQNTSILTFNENVRFFEKKKEIRNLLQFNYI